MCTFRDMGLRTEFAQDEGGQESRDGDQTGDVVRLFECLRNHRVGQHGEHRAGGNGGRPAMTSAEKWRSRPLYLPLRRQSC
jgi:hypothetical protein